MMDAISPLRSALSGTYEFEREIAKGGYATVYLARDLKHNRSVAIKVLNANPARVLSALRFVREVRLLAWLQHPNIVPVVDVGAVDGILYCVMQYVTGETLRSRLEREGRLAIDAACRIGREVADALAYAHDHGILHRDIRPENIFLLEGHAVVADFFVAVLIRIRDVQRLTSASAPETPTYLSPEELLNVSMLDARTDIYSLGCVLYEMLTGTQPFQRESGITQLVVDPPPLASNARDEVAPWLDETISRSLAHNPKNRFSHMREVAQLLADSPGARAGLLAARG
jgi:eukaryotic-like serine/threonine-protein kinase